MAEKRKLKVILDPAHGSDTAGKCSPDKSHFEWKWSRERCKKIKQLLQEQGFSVYYTNDGDTEIGLTKRATSANTLCKGKEGEFLLISPHNNAAGMGDKWMTATGFSVYVANTASSNSKSFANILLDEFKYFFPKVKNRGLLQANFTVISATNCPAVLIEFLFQDNKEEVEMLKKLTVNDKFEESVVYAVMKYNKKIFG